jgi:FdhE protein
VPTPHTDALWRLARAQWARITADSPDLAAAAALQQRLLRLMLDASAALDEPAQASLVAVSARTKWPRGLPALRNETIVIPRALKDILPPLCTALAECGAGDSALHIRDAMTGNVIDAESLLRVSLARNQKAIRTSALHMGFSPDLLWLIGELGSAPLAHHLSSIVQRPASIDEFWNRGYCPFCGSWPAFIEARIGTHTLRCSYCALGWSLQSHRCVYCGNEGEDFVAAAPDVNQPQRRVELCGRCGGYTKVIEVEDATLFPLVAIEDLATVNLDQGAMNRGYRRPELFDLDAIEPRTSTC